MNTPPPIWCLGAAHIDHVGRGRIAPGQSAPGAVASAPGGVAFNIAAAIARAGARAALISAIGDDPAGRQIAAALDALGVDNRLVAVNAPTGAYVAIEDETRALVAAIADDRALSALTPTAIAARLAERPPDAPLIIDANLSDPQIDAALAAPGMIAAEATSGPKSVRLIRALPRLDAIFCNLDEARALTRADLSTTTSAAKALHQCGPGIVSVTNGPEPAALYAHGEVAAATPPPMRAETTNGAGDARAAATLIALLTGASAQTALAAGQAAATRTLRGET